jgi:hypothetical protein
MNCIKYFEIVRDVIEPIIEHIMITQGISRSETCLQIQKYLETIHREYYKKSQPRIPINLPKTTVWESLYTNNTIL